MERRFLTCGLILAAVTATALAATLTGSALLGTARAEDKSPADKTAESTSDQKLPPPPTNAGLEKMKSLVGTWVAAGEDGKPTDQVMSIIKLTAGGSAVHETFFPGQPMEMISLYTAEGSDVLMTHYCVLGNQPRMKASPSESDKQIKFEFAGGSNLDPAKDKHMHGATLTLVDADHLELEGVAWDKGVACKECCGKMKLVRKQ
jgi:hypothetical protein